MSTSTHIAGLSTVAAPPHATSASATQPLTSSPLTSKPLTQASTSSISPRIVTDPSAGIIIQFLTGSGQVELQIPSATVVAYLKAGLTAEGDAKPTDTQI